MKTFFRKNRIVLIALCTVLCFGMLAGGVLFGAMRLSMRDLSFSTVADAYTSTEAPITVEASAAATVPPIKLSAVTIADIVANTEARRKDVIPHRTEKKQANSGSWEAVEIDDAERARLWETADALTVTLFGQTIEALTGSNQMACGVRCLKDTTGFRDTIAIITDADQLYRLTIRAKDGGLLNADLLVFPEHASDPSATLEDAERVTRALGMRATLLRNEIGHSIQEGHLYSFCDKTGTCATVLYYGDRLTQVAVYPDTESMLEDVYFLADVRFGDMNQTYPEDFSEPEEPTDQHEISIAKRILSVVRDAEATVTGNPRKDSSAYTVRVQRDRSGAREDIFVVEGENLNCTVSKNSRLIITMTCEWPSPPLVDIPYEEMDGPEYLAVAQLIADVLLSRLNGGRETGELYVDAVYDGGACTVFVPMSDGTEYELVFLDGVFSEVRYYASDGCMTAGVMGWVANYVFTNKVTGEEIIPSWPEWDGDLHVKKPIK